jgi:hypothetical protein
MLADTFGVLLGGAGFAHSLNSFLMVLAPAAQFQALNTDDPHPPFYVRLRLLTWKALVQQPLSTRTAGSAIDFTYEVLNKAEDRIRDRAVAKGAMLRPDRIETQPNQTASLPVMLYGGLNLDVLEGRLLVNGEDVLVESLQATQALTDSGYRLLYQYPDGK